MITEVQFQERRLFLAQKRAAPNSARVNYEFMDATSDWKCVESDVYHHYQEDDFIGAYFDTNEREALLIAKEDMPYGVDDKQKIVSQGSRQLIQPMAFESSQCLQSISASAVLNSATE